MSDELVEEGLHGRLISMQKVILGDELAVAALAGDLVLTVQDTADFDELGGQLQIADQLYDYVEVDDETSTITLTSALLADAAEGDRVDAWDSDMGTPAVDYVADVLLDGVDSGDPVAASVDHSLVDYLLQEIRDGAAESVTLEWDGDDLHVAQVHGKAAQHLVAKQALDASLDAQAKADQALADADAAQQFAQAKNEVFRQDAMPTGGTYSVGDVWFDTNDGYRIWTWDGAQWVDSQDAMIAAANTTATQAQTDATNAVNTAAAAQTAASQAQTDAAAAQTAAANAQTAATNAQATADGKNKVTYSTSAPGAAANTAGDIWFQKDASNVIIGQWEGAGGTSWIAKTIGNQVIGNLDAGKVTFGTMSGDRLAANSVTVSKLNVVIGGGNLLTNSSFEDTSSVSAGWAPYQLTTTTTTPSTTTFKYGTRSMKLVNTQAGQDAFWGQQFLAAKPNTKYTFSAWVYVESITAGAYGDRGILMHDGNGVIATVPIDASFVTGMWTRLVATITTSAAPAYVEGRVHAPQGTVYWDGAQLEEGDLATAYTPKVDEILPGTINTPMLSATAIDGMVVTGALIQSEVTASRGIKFNSTGLTAYNGSGAATLTIDAATGSIAMLGTLQSGSSIAGATITGTLQTDAAANRGVKLTTAGLTAYDSGGVATFTINGATGGITMKGSLLAGSDINGATVTGGTVQTEVTANRGIKIANTGMSVYDSAGNPTMTITASTGAIALKGSLTAGSDISGATITGGTLTNGKVAISNDQIQLGNGGSSLYGSVVIDATGVLSGSYHLPAVKLTGPSGKSSPVTVNLYSDFGMFYMDADLNVDRIHPRSLANVNFPEGIHTQGGPVNLGGGSINMSSGAINGVAGLTVSSGGVDVTGASTFRNAVTLSGVNITTGAGEVHTTGGLFQDGTIPGGGSTANLTFGGSGRVIKVGTSSRRFKKLVVDAPLDPEAILALRPVRYEYRADAPLEEPPVGPQFGFIAEEAADLGLDWWVGRDADGVPMDFGYANWGIALQVVVRHHNAIIQSLQDEIRELRERVEAAA